MISLPKQLHAFTPCLRGHFSAHLHVHFKTASKQCENNLSTSPSHFLLVFSPKESPIAAHSRWPNVKKFEPFTPVALLSHFLFFILRSTFLAKTESMSNPSIRLRHTLLQINAASWSKINGCRLYFPPSCLLSGRKKHPGMPAQRDCEVFLLSA